MSKLSEERFKIKKEYFSYLAETNEKVDPYVKNKIDSFSKSSLQLNDLLSASYRFGTPQSRPALVRMAYELVGGLNWETIIPACASVELKDTGYYCYDDFLDKDLPKENALLGGLFLVSSYGVIDDLVGNFDPLIVNNIYKEIFLLDRDNSQAAMLDEDLKKVSSEELYLRKAEGYSFWGHAFKMGAILADTNKDQINYLEEVGKNIGIAYIIANDTWDFGKNLEDFTAGKMTLPISYFLKNVDDPDIEKMFGFANLEGSSKDYIRLKAIESGAIDFGKQKSKEYLDIGLSILNSNFPKSRIRDLINFSTTMTQRNKHF